MNVSVKIASKVIEYAYCKGKYSNLVLSIFFVESTEFDKILTQVQAAVPFLEVCPLFAFKFIRCRIAISLYK